MSNRANTKKFIPKEKLSKKAKREIDNSQRKVWVITPITKRLESKKLYKRDKSVIKKLNEEN